MSLHILDFYLFIYGCPVSSLMCAGLLSLQQVGTTALCCGVWASHCGVLSHCRARALGVWAELWITGPAALPHVGSSQTRDPTCVLCIDRRILIHCATRESPLIRSLEDLQFQFLFLPKEVWLSVGIRRCYIQSC